MTKDINTIQSDALRFRFHQVIFKIFIPLFFVLFAVDVFCFVYFDVKDISDFILLLSVILSFLLVIFIPVIVSSYVSYFELRNDGITEKRGYLMGLIPVNYKFSRIDLQSWTLIPESAGMPQLKIFIKDRCITIDIREKKLFHNNKKSSWDDFTKAFKGYVSVPETQLETLETFVSEVNKEENKNDVHNKVQTGAYGTLINVLGILVIGLLVASLVTGQRIAYSFFLCRLCCILYFGKKKNAKATTG